MLAQTPKVLLLDEPTAFLDLQYQWEMLEIVEQARRERGITVVAVLHDLNLASAFSHRMAMMKGGRLAALGTPDEVLTEDITRNVYGRRVTIGRHPATGRPTVVSWPSETPGARNTAIHIISGGGTGAALIRRLNADGHAVTAGVLNIGDTDWETAQALDLDIAEEAPFSSVSEAAYTAAEALVRRASMVLVAPMPIGPGNLDNLRLAAEAAKRGQKVLLIGVMDESRDFTGGLAGPLWDDAVAHGAVVSPDVVSALNTALEYTRQTAQRRANIGLNTGARFFRIDLVSGGDAKHERYNANRERSSRHCRYRPAGQHHEPGVRRPGRGVESRTA